MKNRLLIASILSSLSTCTYAENGGQFFSKIGVIAQTQKQSDGGESENGVMVNIEHKIAEYALKAQYQTLEDNSFWSVGVDYGIAKNTKLYSWISTGHFENKEDTQYLAIGIEYKLSLKF